MVRLLRRCCLIVVMALAVALFVRSGRTARAQHATPSTAPATIDAAAVNVAIEKAKAFLYSKQSADGTWETSPQPKPPESESSRSAAAQSETVGQWGGQTALAVYALLAAGEEATEPKLDRAIEFIRTAELTGTYAVGLRLMALRQLPFDAEIRKTVERDAELLLRSVKTEGEAAGHYDYNITVREDQRSFSHSRSQYGVLGVWAAARMGYRVDPRYWQLVDEGWRRNQKQSGGWNYNTYTPGRAQEESPGMTAAGIASLMITNEFLLGDRAAGCNGNLEDANIDAGLAWLAANFEKLDPEERFRDIWAYITLYNIERLSVTGGLRYVGSYDWYATITRWLLENQRREGSWRRRGSGGGANAEVVDTAFALLFLGRGRSPLLAAKLAHLSTDRRGNPRRPDWNQRPRDLANLAEYTGGGLERELHWQIVNSERPVEEWLDAPILYISGSAALELSEELKTKLKDYVHRGGLLVFNPDCGKRPFVESATRLAEELFAPHKLRVLEEDHILFDLQYPLRKGRRVPRIQAVGNGARELAILLPASDVGRDWQIRKDEAALQLGANLYGYAIDRTHMRYKGDRRVVEVRADRNPSKQVVVGRLKYDGNWDPEPGGWPRLAAVMHNDYDTKLEVREIDAAADALDGLHVLHLTGTEEFVLDEAARGKIKAFVEAGGTLLVDAAGGSGAFATAAERELRQTFGDAADALRDPLPAGHALYAEQRGLPPLTVSYRLDADERLGAPRGPRLRGIERDGRLAVVWSSEDLSVGLVGMPVAGIIGYAPETATALAARVVRAAAP